MTMSPSSSGSRTEINVARSIFLSSIMTSKASAHLSCSRTLTLSHLPEGVLAKVLSYLAPPGNPLHVYHLKHAIRFALNSPHNFYLYHPFFSRITFPSNPRYYGHLAEPAFLASQIRKSSKVLLHLELPEVDPTQPLKAVKDCRPDLVSLSFFDAVPRELNLFPKILLQCPSLQSLIIHDIASETLLQLQHKSVVSQLPNLHHLEFHGIRNQQVPDLEEVLFRFSKKLKSLALSGAVEQLRETSSASTDVFRDIANNFRRFKSLRFVHIQQFPRGDLRKHQGNFNPPWREIADSIYKCIDFLSTPLELSDGPLLFHLRLTGILKCIRNFIHSRTAETLRIQKITFDIPGYAVVSRLPEIFITSMHIAALSQEFLLNYRDNLQLRHIDIGGFAGNALVAERLERGEANTLLSREIFANVKKVSLFVPCRRINNFEMYLDVIMSILTLVPRLDSFELSLHAVFEWKIEKLESVMKLVERKKPRVMLLFIDDLLPPYYAIQCPFSGKKRRHCISKSRLVQLAKFLDLLMSMESVKEVMIEGVHSPSLTREVIKEIAKGSAVGGVDGVSERRKMAMELVQELTKREVEGDIDLSSVIGWLENMTESESAHSSEIYGVHRSRHYVDVGRSYSY